MMKPFDGFDTEVVKPGMPIALIIMEPDDQEQPTVAYGTILKVNPYQLVADLFHANECFGIHDERARVILASSIADGSRRLILLPAVNIPTITWDGDSKIVTEPESIFNL